MITHEKLKEIIHYDPATGLFTWKKQISSHAVPGTPAGSLKHHSGYSQIDDVRRTRSIYKRLTFAEAA